MGGMHYKEHMRKLSGGKQHCLFREESWGSGAQRAQGRRVETEAEESGRRKPREEIWINCEKGGKTLRGSKSIRGHDSICFSI